MNSVAKIQPIVANKKRKPNPFCPSIKDRNKAKNPQIEEIKKLPNRKNAIRINIFELVFVAGLFFLISFSCSFETNY